MPIKIRIYIFIFIALKLLAEAFPDMLLIVDVCICPYADHGHGGIYAQMCLYINVHEYIESTYSQLERCLRPEHSWLDCRCYSSDPSFALQCEISIWQNKHMIIAGRLVLFDRRPEDAHRIVFIMCEHIVS